MSQPDDILADFRKAKRIWDRQDWDRFDEVATPSFWVSMATILARELKKATK